MKTLARRAGIALLSSTLLVTSVAAQTPTPAPSPPAGVPPTGATTTQTTTAPDAPGTSTSVLLPSGSPVPVGSTNVVQTGPYRARSPEYGMNVFVWGNPATTARDLATVSNAGFTWQKSLFKWSDIEPVRGQFTWTEADRVVRASQAAGVKIIARLDFQPTWARLDGAHNGPPDDYADFGRFVSALVTRYGQGSAIGRVHALEIWNEPNLNREWGMAPINQAAASDYVRLLEVAYEAAKAADPGITIISAGLSPTGWNDDTARPDDVYLQWLYDAGAARYFDVLGAHGPGFKAPPEVSPDEAAADLVWGGHRSFTFRRVEDLRKVMEANGDAAKQVWLLEFGWTTDQIHQAYAWHRVTPDQQAQYLVDSYRWAADHWSPWIGVMTLWTLPDPTWGPEREELWWAVANPDGTDRPALTRLRAARQSGELP
ncbi:MAG: cellulase family glycosylhydrolase [Chloroflexi bacterium]|nr:cellulase family glycosylhydrolase [Chloroflexota bacterium]